MPIGRRSRVLMRSVNYHSIEYLNTVYGSDFHIYIMFTLHGPWSERTACRRQRMIRWLKCLLTFQTSSMCATKVRTLMAADANQFGVIKDVYYTRNQLVSNVFYFNDIRVKPHDNRLERHMRIITISFDPYIKCRYSNVHLKCLSHVTDDWLPF